MYGRLMLRKLRIKVRSKSIAVRFGKGDRGSDIKVVEKISYVQ